MNQPQLAISLRVKQYNASMYTPALSRLVKDMSTRVKGALPDKSIPMTSWDIASKLAKSTALNEIEFHVLANRVSQTLSYLSSKGLIYKSTKASLASSDQSHGHGLARKSSYGYAQILGSRITSGRTKEYNPNADHKAALKTASEVQSMTPNQLSDAVDELIESANLIGLTAVRDIVNMRIDDAIKCMVVSVQAQKSDMKTKMKNALEAQLASLDE